MRKDKIYYVSTGGYFVQGEEKELENYCKANNATYTEETSLIHNGIRLDKFTWNFEEDIVCKIATHLNLAKISIGEFNEHFAGNFKIIAISLDELRLQISGDLDEIKSFISSHNITPTEENHKTFIIQNKEVHSHEIHFIFNGVYFMYYESDNI